jgi:hypothetical protein
MRGCPGARRGRPDGTGSSRPLKIAGDDDTAAPK